MPSLMQPVMVEAAKTRFRGFNLSLPTIAATGRPTNIGSFLANLPTSGAPAAPPRSGVTSTFSGGTSSLTSSLITKSLPAIPQPVPPALIKAASSARADVDFQAEVSGALGRAIEAACAAIVAGHNLWRQQAHLINVQVNAITAIGGSVQGPSMVGLVKAQITPDTLFGTGQAFGQAIAEGFDACWRIWQSSVRVPNLAWWPSFAAVPAPMAPPTPNIPTPLASLKWDPACITADVMSRTMKSKQLSPVPYADALYASIATGIARALEMWFPSQAVTNVLGKGPVPTYAPPYVPVGSVVAGDIVQTASNFAS